MRTQHRTHMVLAAVVVAAAAVAGLTVIASAAPGFWAVRLSPQSRDDVARAALQYTKTYMHVLSGEPKVVYTFPVSGPDLPLLGMAAVSSRHPLMLVVVEGDIDVRGAWPGRAWGDSRVKYVNYVFDLEEGGPVVIQAEPSGDVLRRALDPAQRIEPIEPSVPLGTPLPEGVIAPTVVPRPSP